MERIYIAKSRNEYKIGVSVNPTRRMKQLRTGNPDIQLIYESVDIANAYKIEHALHKIYSPYNVGGEWFSNELPYLPKIHESIEKYFPGTKIAITEYGFRGKRKYNI